MTPVAVNTANTQSFISRCFSLIKEISASWRNEWSQGWGKESITLTLEHVMVQEWSSQKPKKDLMDRYMLKGHRSQRFPLSNLGHFDEQSKWW